MVLLNAALNVIFASTVAVVTGTVSLLILLANPRRNWNQWLAFYLFLVCGNFAAQGLHWLYLLQGPTSTLAPWDKTIVSVGFVLLILDPPVLAYFASLFPRRTALANSPWGILALFLLTTPFLFLEATQRWFSDPTRGADLVRLAFFVYLSACYLYAAARIWVNYLAEPSTVMATQVGIVAFGMLVAAVPRAALLVQDLRAGWLISNPSTYILIDWVFRLASLWIALTLAAAWARRYTTDPGRRAASTYLLRYVGFVFLFFSLVWSLRLGVDGFESLGGQPPAWLADVGEGLGHSVQYMIRWFVFSGAMFYGIVRYQVLAVNLRTLALVGLAGIVLATFLGVALGASAFGPWTAATVSALLMAVGVAGAYFLFVQPTAGPRSEEYLHQRGLDVYRALLAVALADGTIAASKQRELDAARRRLGISLREHKTLLAVAEAEELGQPARPVLAGRYQVLKRLGMGGYATVSLAQDLQTNQLVVVKRILDEWAGSRAALESALREVEVARRVSHPHLVAIHDMVRQEDGVLLVMEYVEGGSFRDLLERAGPLPSDRVLELLRETLYALAALHEAGIVHGDLKPENLLLTREGHVKVADFGTARADSPRRTLVQTTEGAAGPGTLAYMAPEQVTSGSPTPRSDLYALGAIAYEALLGHPLVATNNKSSYDILKAVAAGSAEPGAVRWPAGWESFLQRALRREPKDRFPSATKMLGALDQIVRRRPSTSTTPARGSTPTPD